MCGVCFTAYITDNSPAAPASFANFVHCGAKTVARRHSAADHGSAICAHDHTVIGPSRGSKVERSRTDMGLQLGRSADMRKAERLGVDGPPPDENGQTASGPAMLVQRGVYVDHQALPQTAFLPFGGVGRDAPTPGFRKSLTRCCALVPDPTPYVGSILRRQLSPHGVIAAVDMQKLARRHVQVLR